MVRFHPLLFHTLAIPHPPFFRAVPFTPSAEYRSTPRNVVLAFARVPFYPSAWRLIRVSFPHHSSFSILPCFSLHPSLSLVLTRICLPFLASLPLSHAQPANYVSHLPRGSSNTGLPRRSATKRGLMKNENGVEMRVEMRSQPEKQTQSTLRKNCEKNYVIIFLRHLILTEYTRKIKLVITICSNL